MAMNGKLAELLRLTPTGTGSPDAASGDEVGTTRTFTATIDPAFTIGPKVHGGTMQMVVAHAANVAFGSLASGSGEAEIAGDTDVAADASQPGAGQVPIAIASDYLAAPDPGVVDLSVTLRKRGRTVSLVTVDLGQGGRTMVASSVTLGRLDSGPARHSVPSIVDGMPEEPPTEGIVVGDSSVSDVMHLASTVDLVLDPDSFPVARGERGDPVVRGWCRPRHGEPTVDFAVLVCDVSPPVVMNLALFGWAPTVQLTTYVRRQPVPGWLRFAASSVEVGAGMFEEDHLVVDATGAVVAQSRQLALIPQRDR
ncbi:thioesterase family protein [Gordonia sinesedis]